MKKNDREETGPRKCQMNSSPVFSVSWCQATQEISWAAKKNFTREISTSFTLKVWSILFPSSHAVTSLTSLPSWNDKGSLKRSFVEMCEFWAIFIRSCLPWSRVVKDRTYLHLGWKTAEKHQIWGSRLICSKNPSVSFLFKLLVRQVKSSYSCFWNVSP